MKIQNHIYAAILSVLNLLLYHIPFFEFVAEHAEFGLIGRIGLISALVLLVLVLNYVVFFLLLQLLRYVGHILIAILFFLSGAATYFVFVYHNLMDESMMSNVFNTRASEVSGFLSPSLFIGVALLGLIPMLLILFVKSRPSAWSVFFKYCGSCLGIALILVGINIKQVLWIGKYDTELGGLVMPWSYLVNTGLYFQHQKKAQQEEILLPDATLQGKEKRALVLVIGESGRKANWQLYGYERATNPLLSQIEDLHVYPAKACATYTTAGVKCILEHTPTSDLYEPLPNYLYRAGVDVVWRTHNWGEPPIHIDEYQSMDELAKQYHQEPFDQVLCSGLSQRIRQSDKNRVLIVLHTNTSHGPDYQRQYPSAFEQFTPVCSRVEDAQKEPENLRNAYDNTIVYTDYILANLIDSLRAVPDWDCAMLYVSDHGESLGENNLFMHGVPLQIAPKEQYEIPFLLWVSDKHQPFRDTPNGVDHHFVFHTVLHWLQVSSEVYNPQYDLLK